MLSWLHFTLSYAASVFPRYSKYIHFLEQRIKECLEENKRYLLKYQDLRQFSYTHIEYLIRKNQGKQVVNKNTLNIYKQLVEKERKHMAEEREKKDQFIQQVQSKVN